MHQQPYAGELQWPPRGPRRSKSSTRSGHRSAVSGWTSKLIGREPRLMQLELLAVRSPVVLAAARLDRHFLAHHLALDRHRAAFAAQRAGEHLELLLQRELAL